MFVGGMILITYMKIKENRNLNFVSILFLFDLKLSIDLWIVILTPRQDLNINVEVECGKEPQKYNCESTCKIKYILKGNWAIIILSNNNNDEVFIWRIIMVEIDK